MFVGLHARAHTHTHSCPACPSLQDAASFYHLFPFHFVMNSDGRLLQVGCQMCEIRWGSMGRMGGCCIAHTLGWCGWLLCLLEAAT